MKISAVIITYNEERNIGRCLESLHGLVDEVVVVDSFSKDSTESICLSHGARFIQNSFEGHIQQKNFAAKQATHDWVLSLDADEAISPQLREQIIAAKQGTSDTIAFKMNRLTNYCGQWIHHCGWYPDTKIRLFRRDLGEWGGVNPHDKWIPYNEKASLPHLRGDILHYSYYTVDEHYRQAEKFSTIAAEAAHKVGKTSNGLIIAIKTTAKFLRNYLFRLGFFDGKAGYTICRIAAWETYLKYKKLRKLTS